MTEASQVKLTNRQIWKTLGTHYESISNVHLRTFIPELESKTEPGLTHDSSTHNLIRRYRKSKNA